jgi:hypothetical protein
MAFMMSKSAYLYDEGDYNGPHLMFFTALTDGKNWGAGASGSPVVSGPYWFLSSKERSQAKGLPPIVVFAGEVAKWSDGTAAVPRQNSIRAENSAILSWHSANRESALDQELILAARRFS